MSDNSKSAVANAGNLIIPESDWYSFYYEQTSGIELESQAGVLGILEPAWYDFYYEQQQVVYATGSSLSSVEGQQLTSYIGETNQVGTAYNQITGILATSSSGTVVISGTENVSVIVSGVESSATFGEISAQGQTIINAEILLSNVSAEANISQISATADNPVTWSSSGQIKRYPSNQFFSATAKIGGASSEFAIGEIQTNATTVINATISLNNVVSFVQASDINASGTLEISEEELVLLLAA